MSTDLELKEIGNDLKIYAENEAEFSARGVIDELFPSIFMASKRMSTRAISRWLMEMHKIKLSPVTIAKALREADQHWEEYFETIAPAAQIFGNAHDASMADFLLDPNAFCVLRSNEKKLKFSGEEGYHEYQRAAEIIEQDWFQALDERAREECSQFISDETGKHKGKTGGEHGRGKRKQIGRVAGSAVVEL